MRKPLSGEGGRPEAEGGRRPTGVPGRAAGPDRGRWSSRRKMEAILRLLKGENLDALSRELGVSGARLTQWRDEFLAAGQTALQSREPADRDDVVRRLKAKIGDLTMDNELLLEKIHRMEANLSPDLRRPRR